MTKPEVSRRGILGVGSVLFGGGALTVTGCSGRPADTADQDAPTHTCPESPPTQRPSYHVSVPDNWKNDPQRPIYVDGEYLYYYLYNEDYLEGGPGTSWRLATTRDHVAFEDQGVAIPKFSNDNGDVWSGSVVVDHDDTAGYGSDAVVALATQAPEGVQGQYLWYSTDGGRSFTPGPDDPVIANPGVPDFRDPKVIWDDARDRWFCGIAEGSLISFYVSSDLVQWDRVGEFQHEGIGLLECPDLFRMSADDGSDQWILGISANGKARGLPATYAYWLGEFDGESFEPMSLEPQWLDWGCDFYGAVTYDAHRDDGAVDESLRRAIGWSNFWDYPHNTPTLFTDSYNGDDTIVREVRLLAEDGGYYLASSPAGGLVDHATETHELGEILVDDTHDLDIAALAYSLECEVEWDAADPPQNIGVELCRAPQGGRHVAAGLFLEGGYAYVNRRPTISPAGEESQTPVDPAAGRMRLHLLVDRASVEAFFGDGRYTHSHRVFPLASDDRIRLFVSGGEARFQDLVIRELQVG